MPYIGNTPALDYISYAVQNFTVTAGTTSYALDYSVANENDIRLVINNVIQRPGASFAYSATGTTLTLTSATLATDTMYAVFIGRAVQTVTPPTSSVTNTMLTPSVITGQTAVTVPATDDVLLCYDTSATALRKITFANFGNAPAWRVYNSSNQTGLSYNAFNTVSFNTVDFDTNSGFNTSTYKYVVPTTGKYYINFQFGVIGASANLITIIGQIYNETTTNALISHQEITNADQSSSGNTYIGNISGIVNLTANDSLYGRVYCFGSSGTLTINSGTAVSFFGGYRLIGV
jgi:hypothetical protein